MLNSSLKYALLSLVIVLIVGCTPQRKITVYTPIQANPQTQRPVVTPSKRPPIKEEILLGRHANSTNSSSQTSRPKKNPTVESTPSRENTGNRNRRLITRMPFPVSEYRHLSKQGSSTVSGKVHLTNKITGNDITKAKIKLWLNPVTSYSKQWYNEVYLGGNKLTKIDKRLYNYLKFTYSSANGKFNFFGVPSGNYYLTATIKCSVECGYRENKSVLLVKKVYVGRGTTEVELSKRVP